MRRRPVPRVWREDNHWLNIWTSYRSAGSIRGTRVFRARGRCSCGAEFNPAHNPDGSLRHSNNMTPAAVREAWKDHVEDAYYNPEEGS